MRYMLAPLCLAALLLATQPILAFPVGGILINPMRAAYITPFAKQDSIFGLSEAIQELQELGYEVDVVSGGNATVGFLREKLSSYDLIVIRTGAVWQEGPYRLLTGERAVNSTDHSEDLKDGALHLVSGYYAVTGLFFAKYYGNGGLAGKIIIMLAPNMGMIASVLVNGCGATVIGFMSPQLSLAWGTADLIARHLIHYLCLGMTVREAVSTEYRHINGSRWGDQGPYGSLAYGGNGGLRLSAFS